MSKLCRCGLPSRILSGCRYDPTIEDSYSVTRTIDGTTYSLLLTDTAGQEEYRGLWSSSNLTSDAFLLVYDITSESTLEQLEYFNSLIDMERETRMERGSTLPVCIVAGNKCDLQSLRQVGARQGLEWARSRGYGFMETSAREMVNIEETFARMSYIGHYNGEELEANVYFPVLVRRVVEARKNRERGITPGLPNSTARTQPLDPLPPSEEKDSSPRPEGSRLKRFFRKLKCW